MRKILAIVLFFALAVGTAAQQPPPPATASGSKPTWTMLPDPIAQKALPDLGKPAEWISKVGEKLEQPELVLIGDAVGLVADIHDSRKAEAERARVQANDAMKRDLYAAGISNFSLDDCAMFNPKACVEMYKHFSPETQKAIDTYMDKQDRYLWWTDVGNVSRRAGWTAEETVGVVQHATTSGVERAMDDVTGGADTRSGDRRIEYPAIDAAAAAAKARLSAHESAIDQRAANEPKDAAAPVDVQFPTDAELRAGADAASSQGGSIVQSNAQAKPAPSQPAFGDQYAVSVNQEFHRLDDSEKAAGQKLDADSQRVARESAARDADAAAWLRAIVSTPQPAPQPYTPGGLQIAPPAPPPPTPLKPLTPAKPAAPKVDHCPNGVFVCPNGRAWKDCTHPEKYSCPPPGAVPVPTKK